MKRFLTIVLAAAMVLSMAACGEKAPEQRSIGVVTADNAVDTPQEDEAVPEADTDSDIGEVEALAQFLTEKGLYLRHYQAEAYSDMYEHPIEEYWVYELLTDKSKIYLRLFDSEETAKKEASNYQNGDVSKYSYAKGEETAFTIIDYATPVWMWQYGAAIVEFGRSNGGEYVRILSEELGDWFAGMTDSSPEAVQRVTNCLDEHGLQPSCYQEDASRFTTSYNGDKLLEVWAFSLISKQSVRVKIYDSPETAKGVVDHGGLSYMWQDGAAVIEFPDSNWLSSTFLRYESADKILDEEFGAHAELRMPVRDFESVAGYDAPEGSDEPIDLSLVMEHATDSVLAVVDGDKCASKVVSLAAVDIQHLEKIVDGKEALISSLSELESYIAANKEALSNDECKNALGSYKKGYFEKSSLLLVPLESGTLNDSFTLREMQINRRHIVLEIDEVERGEDALDFKMMIVELKNVKFDKEMTKIKVKRQVVPNVFISDPEPADGGDLPVVLTEGLDGKNCAYNTVQLASADTMHYDAMTSVLISDFAELESYRKNNKSVLANSECKKALDAYDSDYFKKSSLLAVPLFEGSINEDYRVEKLTIGKDDIGLTVEGRDTGDEMEDYKLMIVELENMKFDKMTTKIRVSKKTVLSRDVNPITDDPIYAASAVKLDFKYDKVRTDGAGYPRQTLITDRGELDEYYEQCSAGWFNRLDRFKAKTEGYTDEWFKEHSLIIVAVEYGSGSTEVFVDSVVKIENGITVILRTVTPEVSTCDMAGWQLLVETPKLSGSETVTVSGAKGICDGVPLATE